MKTLIRLGGCPGWSEASLGAHSLCRGLCLFVMSWLIYVCLYYYQIWILWSVQVVVKFLIYQNLWHVCQLLICIGIYVSLRFLKSVELFVWYCGPIFFENRYQTLIHLFTVVIKFQVTKTVKYMADPILGLFRNPELYSRLLCFSPSWLWSIRIDNGFAVYKFRLHFSCGFICDMIICKWKL